MTFFISGLVLFFATHFFSAFRSREPGRDIKEKLGHGPYMGLYSIISLAGFALIVIGYGQLRPSPIIFDPPGWGRFVNYVLMIPAFIFLASSQFPKGHIKARLRHPMLVSVKIWALGHIVSNGELNALILFAAFLAYAVINRIAVKRRAVEPDTGEVSAKWDVVSVIVGLAAYVAFYLWLHQWLIGVPVHA